jgi:uncharacterized protein YfaS (alpha-2-macroglobulin family)
MIDMRSLPLTIARFVRGLLSSLPQLPSRIVGHWQWQPPAWMPWIGRRSKQVYRYLHADPKRAMSAIVGVVVVVIGLIWYWNLPTPHYSEYTVLAPSLTEYDEKGIKTIHPMKVSFTESVAPLKNVEKQVTEGVELSPTVPGTWFWVSDRDLMFTPKDDWPIGAAFKVSFARKGFFDQTVRLEDYRFEFSSAAFAAAISESSFYQDPLDPTLKKVITTIKFSHPVDTTEFERRVSLTTAKDAEYLGLHPDSRFFTVLYDKFNLAAHVHSASLAIPKDDTPMTVRIDKGVHAARGGNDTSNELKAVVTIPGRSSLKFSGAHMTLVDNARYEPEQILLLTSSSPVAEKALTGNVFAYVLPVRHPDQPKEQLGPYRWSSTDQVPKEILDKSDKVTLTYVPSSEGGNTAHGMKFLAPVGRYLYVLVKNGVQGIGGYIAGKPYEEIVQVEPYQPALTFLGQGALLSLTGDKKVGFLARDVKRVEVEIGRLLPNQLQHLSPTMWDFSKPGVYEDLEGKMVERFRTVRDYSGQQPGKPSYDSIDLAPYLQDRSQTRKGLFLLHVRPARAPQQGAADDTEDLRDYSVEAEDNRLILITDMGIVAKQSKDGSRDIFVQSFRTGEPVIGARVQMIGNNGLAVQTASTDANGRARLPKPPQELRRERQPTMLLVEKDDDYSFLPLNTGGRQLDFSRFDTGGVENAGSPQQLSTFMFSDRGIYRPGETTHLGLLTRTADWSGSLSGLPIEVEITDARGTAVQRTPLKLSAAAFDEIEYTSQPASPTGTYQASAFLVKDPRRPELLGSTSFKVQEFEPDRMKVQLSLTDQAANAWIRPSEVKARISAAHLFGEPASNRRVDGEMTLTPVLPQFPKYADYRFQIGEGLKEPYHENLASLVTDDKGNAEFKLDLRRFVGRAYRLSVLGRAYEAEGGRNVAAQNAAIVSDAPYLVGVKPDGDLNYVRRSSAKRAHWLAVNQLLAPVAADELTLEWVQRKFVSVLTQQGNRTYKYESKMREIVRDSKSVTIAAGGTYFPLPTDEPGDFLLLLRNSAGTELNRLSYSVAGQANISRSLERNAELQVQLDKSGYAGGETIEVSIRAPYTGAGLITIERDRVLQHQWFKTSTTSTVQRIALPPDFEGNGYVNVQFLRDPASDELFLSPLSYGVAAFSANLAARTQQLTMTAPAVVKPGAPLSVRLRAAEPSRAVLIAVDEGILQVARYKNPDPLGYFFQKRMLEVNTSQILDLILPEYKRFLALAAPGGDADGGFSRHLNPFAKKRKPPVAYWSGLIDVGPEGKEVRYNVPDYFNGKLRLIAIAVGPKRVGVADGATEVRGDFILTPNVPAMIAPGDEFLVSVGIFNNTTGGKGPIQAEAQVGPELTAMSPLKLDLQIEDKKEGVAEFRFKANSTLGSAALKFFARRSNAQAKMDESVSVRPAVPFRTQLTLGRVNNAKEQIPVKRDLFTQLRQVDASVSTLPLVWGQGLVAYLDNYTYSCTEQLVSKGMSALIITSRPEFGNVKGKETLANAYSILQSRQNDSGGMGLWTSSPTTAEFATVYSAHFLIEAKERGQQIPPGVLDRVNNWLSRFATTPANSLSAGRARAYAVYLLTRQGIRSNAALSNVEQELTKRYAPAWQSDLAAAYLASTYRLIQRNDDAERIIRNLKWADESKHDWLENVYYDPLVHDAQYLYLISRHFPTRLGSLPPTLLDGVARTVSGGNANSLSAAYTLIALDAYAKATGTAMKLGISEIGKDNRERVLPLPASSIPKVNISENAAKVQFSKDGTLPAYYAFNESGFDRAAPTTVVSQGVEIVREFVDMKGNPLTKPKVGEEFLVRIRLRSTQLDNVSQVAVVDLLPGGVEAVLEIKPAADSSEGADVTAAPGANAGFATLPIGLPDKSTWTPQYIDVRDDRLMLYGDITRDARSFVYRVRATNAGVFQSPPPFAEGMYDRKISGYGLAGRLEIVKP